MAIDYTTTELVADLKRRVLVPTKQSLFDESEFIAFMSNEMISKVVPLIMRHKEDYFVKYEDQTVIAGTDDYAIPIRAIGAKLKDICFVDAEGTESPIDRIEYGDKQVPQVLDVNSSGGFYFRGNYVVLHPSGDYVGKTLRLYYYRRPNRLVKANRGGKILSINTGTKEVTLDSAPTDWTAATVVDVTKGKPPFDPVADDQTLTNKAGFVLTFSSLPSRMAVGDYIAEQYETIVPQVPYEAYPLISQLGGIKVVEGLGNTAKLQAAQAKFNELEKEFVYTINPRADEKPKRAISRTGLWRSTRIR